MGAPVLYEIYGEEGSQNGTIEDGGIPYLLSHYWVWAMILCQQAKNLVKVQVGLLQPVRDFLNLPTGHEDQDQTHLTPSCI